MTTKAARIVRRTLTGGSLALVVTGLLWWASVSPDGRPVLWASSVVLFAAIYEVLRMGAMKGRLPDLVLLVPAGALILLQDAASRAESMRRNVGEAVDPEAWAWAHTPHYGIDLATSVLLGTLVFGVLRSLKRVRLDGWGARVVLCALFGVLYYIAFQDPLRVRYWLLVDAIPLLLVSLTTFPLLFTEKGGFRDLGIAVGLAAWFLPPLPALWGVWHDFGALGLAALIILSKIGDTAGYYAGNAFGRSHPFPNLSPGKTTEGCLASLLAGILAGVALVAVGWLPSEPMGLWGGALAGAATNIAAQAGDLLESWVKRRAGVKDSSTLFGPSGGFLDQLDSLLFSIPVCVLLWRIFFSLPGTAG